MPMVVKARKGYREGATLFLAYCGAILRLGSCSFGEWVSRASCTALAVVLFCMSADLHAAEERYSYDESGRLISVDYGGGQGIVYVYDTRGNLLRRQIIRFTDADEDFIDDEWERTHFNSIDRAGDLDFDKDGQTDLAEFLSGTDPTDPKSALRIRRISKLEGAPSFLIEWDAVSERVYQVQYKDDLDDVLWKDLGGRVTALGNVASLLDDTAEASGNRYYRISLVR